MTAPPSASSPALAPIAHATLIAARDPAGEWRGALLRGPSGIGKSDLALCAASAGWRLVADDRVMLWRSGSRLFGRSPAALHALCEARGQGVVVLPTLPFSAVGLMVDLVGAGATDNNEGGLDRQPEPRWTTLAGIALAHVRLRAGEASTLPRLRHAWAGARTGCAGFDTKRRKAI